MKLFRKTFRKARETPKAGGSAKSDVDSRALESPEPQKAADTDKESVAVVSKNLESVEVKSLSETDVAVSEPSVEPESSPQEALREAAKKLKERIEKSGIDSTQFGLDPIHGSYDINSLAGSLELALDKLMEKTKVPDATQNVAKAFTKEWAKKSLPFLEKGLSTAQDVVPAPYNLIVFGILLTVKVAKSGLGLDEEIRKTLTDLSQAIESVKINARFPQLLDEEKFESMRNAALYLTAAIMDCLALLLKGATQSGKLFNAPDIEEGKTRVYRKLDFYGTTTSSIALSLQAEAAWNEEEKKILEWIWSDNKPFKAIQTSDLVQGAGEWFFRSPQYTDWVSQGPSVLICPGNGTVPELSMADVCSWSRQIVSCVPLPSIGNVANDSSVIFNQLKQTPQLGILYFLFSHANKDQKAEDVVRMLLKQILGQLKGHLPSSVKEEYKRYQNDIHQTMPTPATFTKLLAESISVFAKVYSNDVFILIDAFDEFQTQENQRRERKRLTTFLCEINETKKARILITTRPEHRDSLQTSFERSGTIEIKADPTDIDKYLGERMENETVGEELKETIKNKVREGSKGLFLLAKLQTEYVLRPSSVAEKRRRLFSLPQTPEAAYREILESRISDDDKEFAKQIFSWIFYARRTLMMRELQEALVIEPSERSVNHDSLSKAEDILHACGSLVDHNKETDDVSFSHELVRKYLEDHQSELLFQRSEIALSCLIYLCLPVFDKPASSYEEVFKRHEEFSLSVYATSFWAEHLRETRSERNVEAEIAVFEVFRSEDRGKVIKDNFSPQGGLGGKPYLIHILCQDRIGFIVTRPLSDNRITACPGLDVQESVLLRTPLGCAAEMGDAEMVKWLLDHGADINKGYDPPWLLAHRNQHVELAKYLINDNLTKIGELDRNAWLALWGAAIYGIETRISHAQRLSQINTQDAKWGSTAFFEAIQLGEFGFAKWLVEEYSADINIPNDDGTEALWPLSAGRRWDEEFLERLVMEVKIGSKGAQALLYTAAAWRSRKLIDRLIRTKKVDINAVSSEGKTALYMYLANEEITSLDLEVLEWLADTKSINQEVGWDGTPLLSYLELRNSQLTVAKWLVEKGADVTAVDGSNSNALHLAARAGNLEIAKWLVEEKGADIMEVDKLGLTALHYAAMAGNLEVVKWLVKEKGADVDENITPITIARDRHHYAVAEWLESLRGNTDSRE